MSHSVAHAEVQLPKAVIARLGQFVRLSSAEMGVLHGLPQTARHYPAFTDLRQEGQIRPPLLLLSGWACGRRLLRDGRRQIIRFWLPGDAIGSLSHPSMPVTMAASALTPVVVADARPLLQRVDETGVSLPGFAQAATAMARADEVSMCDHVVRLGRQTAVEKLLNLLLELHARLQVVGLATDNDCALPLTQEMLADALGLSVVHVNRTLQQVRRDGLLDIRSGQVTFRQMEAVRLAADWMESPTVV